MLTCRRRSFLWFNLTYLCECVYFILHFRNTCFSDYDKNDCEHLESEESFKEQMTQHVPACVCCPLIHVRSWGILHCLQLLIPGRSMVLHAPPVVVLHLLSRPQPPLLLSQPPWGPGRPTSGGGISWVFLPYWLVFTRAQPMRSQQETGGREERVVQLPVPRQRLP